MKQTFREHLFAGLAANTAAEARVFASATATKKGAVNTTRKLLAVILTGLLGAAAHAEGPPQSNGTISNPTLVQNQNVAKAQAAGVITTFMNEGAKTCDADGKNCHSVFGADDTPDYTRLQMSSQALTGVSAFSFLDPDDGGNGGGDSKSISSQMGTLALACGDTSVKKVAGIAVKLTDCAVTASGDASITLQVCSAPMRGNPVTPPQNQVECSNDPSAPNFRAPTGYVCKRPACDTEPQGSLDGWSAPQTISYKATLPSTATADQKSNNGLGLIFYPPLTGGTIASFTSDSDNMTAVKVVQTFVNNETQRTAVGLKVAYRHKTQVTKEMMVQGASSVPNPSENTAQWDTIVKLQGNEKIPQYQQKYGANGSECLQQITNGMAKDGIVSVCDQNYTNESGIKPGAKTAQVATEGQDCGTTPQCLKQVVNTTTWEESCSAEVPLAMRSCSTTQDYAMNNISYTRTKTQEICHENRFVAEYACSTYAIPERCQRESLITVGGIDINATTGDSNVVLIERVDDVTARFRIGAVGDNYWGTGYYKREFIIDINNKNDVQMFRMYGVGYDDELAVAVNDEWVWSEYGGGSFNPSTNSWGRWSYQCVPGYDMWGDYSWCATQEPVWQTHWERSTSWNYGVNVDFRPKLREGRNVIRMDTGVVGGGEGWLFLEISAWRAKCDFPIQNTCSSYEAAK